MITWVTVWVLTVTSSNMSTKSISYQLQYAKEETCLVQKRKHEQGVLNARCDFQQIPMVIK